LDKTTYRDALEALSFNSIMDPTPEDVARVTPHLDATDIATIFAAADNENESCSFASPALLVDGTFQCLYLSSWYKRDGRMTRNFSHFRAVRIKRQFPDQAKDYLFTDKALAYAEEHWGNTLVSDASKGYQEIWIRDMRQETTLGDPLPVLKLCFTTDWPIHLLLKNGSRPLPDVIESSIVHLTGFAVEGSELADTRRSSPWDHCARCGGRIGHQDCDSCGLQRKKPFEYRYDHNWLGWLGPKMIACAKERGHVFEIDPMKIHETHYRNWMKSNGLEE
jgi:hypothetical protein